MLNIKSLFKDYIKEQPELEKLVSTYQSGRIKKTEFQEKLRIFLKQNPISEDLAHKAYDQLEKPKTLEGQKWNLKRVDLIQKYTSPPNRFSQAGLIKKLEELGIGRPSTYANILSTLEDRKYIEMEKKAIVITNLGKKINQLLDDNFPKITSSSLTSEMEENLDQIAKDQEDYIDVLSEFWFPFKSQVQEKQENLSNNKEKYKSSNTDLLCPTCQASTTLRLGRFGEYYQCSKVSEHRFPKNFREYEKALVEFRAEFDSQTKGKKCQICQKDLIVRVSRKSLKPYIACPDYKVGNKHTVIPITYGKCPLCQKENRDGVLLKKYSAKRKQDFFSCSLEKKVCGYTQSIKPKVPEK